MDVARTPADWKESMRIPEPGQYLVFQEYLDGHGGGQYPVVDVVSISDDVVSISDDLEPDGDPMDPRCREVRGWCDSTGYDGIVTLEFWSNGEVYASGDGFNHPRYRVTDIRPVELPPETEDFQITDARGTPVYWDTWTQDSWDDQPGTKVEFRVKFYANGDWHWGTRKAFAPDPAQVKSLVDEARAELSKPKYYRHETEVLVSGEVVWTSRRTAP